MNEDLTGRVFDRLKVIRQDGVKEYRYARADGTVSVQRRPLWLCECSCGRSISVLRESLVGGRTKSCGCLRRERAKSLLSDIDKSAPRPHPNPLKTTGDYMRKAREEAGLTQNKLANLACISRNSLCRAERGEHCANLGTIIALADVLGLSIDEYIGHEVGRRYS